MADEPRPTPPVLARDSLERVLARAAELQAKGGDTEPGALTEAQLIELAGEVGLSRDHVRLALAEERARIPVNPESGAAFALLGTAIVQAGRTVPGEPAAVLAALDAWMHRTEGLQVKRRFGDQMAWEPRQDFVTSVRRALRLGGRGFHLTVTDEVRGVVAGVEGGRSHVRLAASLAATRGQRSTLALVVAGAGVLVGLPLFWVASNSGLAILATLALVPALAIPMLAITTVRNRYRAIVGRAQIALEQALDRLEHGGR